MSEALDDPDDPTRLPPRRSDWNSIAVIGSPHEDDFDVALGYLQAADILASHWIRNGTNDALPVPIYYNYRHGIELSLKGCIRVAASCLRRDGAELPPGEPDKLVNACRLVLSQPVAATRRSVCPPRAEVEVRVEPATDRHVGYRELLVTRFAVH
ncbi:hypothetical protein OG604_15015 [Streptomyces sp. NBC_01231]|nr:hypothetical protein OG604_15015 [Streptomyces sp. NBC_01231]